MKDALKVLAMVLAVGIPVVSLFKARADLKMTEIAAQSLQSALDVSREAHAADMVRMAEQQRELASLNKRKKDLEAYVASHPARTDVCLDHDDAYRLRGLWDQ